jgi:hypothetical protein
MGLLRRRCYVYFFTPKDELLWDLFKLASASTVKKEEFDWRKLA